MSIVQLMNIMAKILSTGGGAAIVQWDRYTRSFLSRQSGGGSVIVWAALSFNGLVGLAFLNGWQNSPKYIETLGNHLMPFAENIGRRNWEYQHDNSPIHTSQCYEKLFKLEKCYCS
ncbi:hypothetical protein AVEN_140910-1 [Araneus ventricosus]|uniref:Transposable element Tc3 transposase n=1 Tax=Araneus ventricosus TaxID=182803 RepID=A0A4Y2JPT9_ARAVE|nr:hypothetical protein AVEN_140910-1 [Araneus ventricosus]